MSIVEVFSVKQRIPTGGNIRYKKLYLKLAFSYNISRLFYGQVLTGIRLVSQKCRI